jgi:hypothetical protein
MTRIVTMHPRGLLVSALCGLLVLAVADPAVGAAETFDGSYTGKRVLTHSTTPQCVSSEDVSVTINGNVLKFTNSALHDFGIGFYPHPDGSFGLISAAIGGAAVLIRGRIVGGVLDADVTNGPCQHHWHLMKGAR